MIEYEVFQFAAPPGTGVAWFLKAMQIAGYGPGFRAVAHVSFGGPSEPLRVSLVTNPFDWLYRAYLSFEEYSSVVGMHDVDRKSFSRFVGSFLSKRGFSLSDVFDRYKADIVLRLEDMPWALIELLEAVGTETRLLNQVNTLSGLKKYPVVSTDCRSERVWRQVREKEWDLFDRYDYC